MFKDLMYVESLVREIAEDLDRKEDNTEQNYVDVLDEIFAETYVRVACEVGLTTEKAEELQSIQDEYEKILFDLEPEDQSYSQEGHFYILKVKLNSF